MKKYLAIGVITVLLGSLAIIYHQSMKVDEIVAETPQAETRQESVTLIAAGDCLMHNTQIWSGLQEDGTYRFSTFFADVEHLIKAGDYASTNFEAPMAGPEGGYKGYPRFNSPDAMAATFKNAGFDLIVTANNHAMDKGVNGCLRTLDVLHAAGLDTVGTYQNQESSSNFLIKDIRGVKVGYVAYTYGTNGIPVPEDYTYLVNFMDKEKIMADIKELRPQVDILVAVLHWGIEYAPKPTPEQVLMAHELCDAGVDVILGSHPHVIQTMEIVNTGNKDRFVIYSMGNFISHQRGMERNSGIILQLKFNKNFSTGETILQEASYIPTYSYNYIENGKYIFRVAPVEETIKRIEAGEAEPFFKREHLPVLRRVLESTRKQLGEPYYRLSN